MGGRRVETGDRFWDLKSCVEIVLVPGRVEDVSRL